MGGRFKILVVVIGFAYGFLLFNLYHLQLSQGQYYLARAGSQYSASGALEAPRGMVYFTDAYNNHLPVALNKDFPTVYAVPKVMEDVTVVAKALAPILKIPQKELETRFAKRSSYEALVKKAPEELAKKVRDLDLKGVYIDTTATRYYPLDSLASQLLGFVAPSDTDFGYEGRYGIEEFYNTHLAGIPGELTDGKVIPPVVGKDLTLTLDPNIQKEAEQLLSDLVKQHGAPGGSVIVQEPKTGKILALANSPQFDLNNYGKAAITDFLNPVTQQVYEPGSVFKVLTMAAGIDAGKITPHTPFNDTGKLTLNSYTIRNWDLKAHGAIDMTTVIERSLNTGAAFAQRQTGDETFKDYLLKFGFAEKSGIDLPGELKGDLRSLFKKDAPPINFATASFGQGVAATPLQVINAVSSLANGGKLMRPYVNEALGPKVVHNVLKSSTAKQVTEMMVSAVDFNKVAVIPGYTVAGKTGTAQLPDFQNGGYSDKVVNTYVGFAPASDPKVTVLVKLNQPKGAPLAGQTVVPVFQKLMQFTLNYYNIPPDRVDSSR